MPKIFSGRTPLKKVRRAQDRRSSLYSGQVFKHGEKEDSQKYYLSTVFSVLLVGQKGKCENRYFCHEQCDFERLHHLPKKVQGQPVDLHVDLHQGLSHLCVFSIKLVLECSQNQEFTPFVEEMLG